MNENELETIPEVSPDTVDPEPDPVPELETPSPSQTDNVPASEKDSLTSGNGQDNDSGDAGSSIASDPDETETDGEAAESGTDAEDGEEIEDGDGEEEGETGNTTQVTVIHPPAQQITYYADEDAEYHVIVGNPEASPVPVILMETRVETVKEPGIMEKRLEDYTVTEGLLLCILIVLVLRMVFDYGRRFI